MKTLIETWLGTGRRSRQSQKKTVDKPFNACTKWQKVWKEPSHSARDGYVQQNKWRIKCQLFGATINSMPPQLLCYFSPKMYLSHHCFDLHIKINELAFFQTFLLLCCLLSLKHCSHFPPLYLFFPAPPPPPLLLSLNTKQITQPHNVLQQGFICGIS